MKQQKIYLRHSNTYIPTYWMLNIIIRDAGLDKQYGIDSTLFRSYLVTSEGIGSSD